MIPIAGTLRKDDRATFPERLARFVEDPKEINELFQVLDEEMKMMSLICPEGGKINGPYLREIGAVVHSEVRAGRQTRHQHHRGAAPYAARADRAGLADGKRRPVSLPGTSPTRGVITAARPASTRRPRTDEPNGDLDCAILIRCAEIFDDGSFNVQSGGGLVRDSVPEDEARESRAKGDGVFVGADRSRRKPKLI